MWLQRVYLSRKTEKTAKNSKQLLCGFLLNIDNLLPA
jgi:hypothetical protein